MKTFTIGTNDANQRFDKYLKKLLPNASVSFLYRCFEKRILLWTEKKRPGRRRCKKARR